MELWVILTDIVFLLSASLLVGGLFSRLGQSPIVGYLLAGMVLGGPGSVRLVSSQHAIEAISELGVALLLFSLGLEFSIKRLRSLGSVPLLGGTAQVITTMLAGFGCAVAFGLEVRQGIAFGAMIALSSTAVVLRILMERGEVDMPHGRNCLGVLLTQDIAIVPLALLMTILGGEGSYQEIFIQVGELLLFAAALIVGLHVLTRVAVLALGTLTLQRNRELTVIFAIVAGLGAAVASHSMGISAALGAFVAGMMLGSSPFATQIRADVSPLQVVLLTLFFGAAGMVADPIWIYHNWIDVVGVTIGIVVLKLFLTWMVFLCLGQSVRVAAATGISLAQIGEFAFVLGSIGRTSGVVDAELYALIVSVAIISFFLTAFFVPLAPHFGDRVARFFHKSAGAGNGGERLVESTAEVAIIGFGPAAQRLAIPLVETSAKVVVLDLNTAGVNKAIQLGFQGEVGDARQFEVLEHANVNNCKIVAITVPHQRTALQILESVRRITPHAHIVIRSRYEIHTGDFIHSGAHAVYGDEHEVGERMGVQMVRWLNSSEGESDAPIDTT